MTKKKAKKSASGGNPNAEKEAEAKAAKQRRIDVAVRFIKKEAEYLMRCGRNQAAIISVNRILHHLKRFNLDIQAIFGETMKPYTQVSRQLNFA
jgi:hypothetical protein